MIYEFEFRDEILDVLPVGVTVTRPNLEDNVIIYANKAFFEITGYEKGDVLQKDCRFLQGTDRNQEGIKVIKESLLSKKPCQVVLRNYRKNGELFWNRVTISPVFNKAGDLIYYVGIQQDVTSEILAMEEAKSSREKLISIAKEWRMTVDSIPDMILLTDANKCILRCNWAFKDFLRLPYDRIVNRKLEDFFSSVFLLKGLSLDDVFYSASKEFKIGDNFYEIRNYRIESKERNTEWLHVIRDISREKAHQIEMKRLETAINHISEAILIADKNGTIQQVNSAFERITLFKKEEVIGRHHFATFWDISPKEKKQVYEKVSSGESWNGVFETRKKTGEKYLEEMSISPVLDDSGNVINYVIVKRDVTFQRKFNDIISAINLAENMGYAFMALRHEIGNPVNTMKTTLKVMEKSIESWEKEKILEYVKRLSGELSRIEYLLSILRSFRLSDEIRRKPIEAKEFFTRFLGMIEEELKSKGIKIKLHLDGKIKFLGDESALHQVMLNLFSNASDALEGREQPTITLKVAKTGSFVEISVADNGIGMTEEQKENIFKPFWTTKPKGRGIGLALVKNMVSRMFGNVEVESEVGKGTVVKILLEAYEVKDIDR
ncbi:MAG: PAS domain-containing protein [Pyrinomonadaceae bacterium]|nr:PAS domain-containing protein [Pyrinomonadaceae bacterium]MCX7640733.1 PAS domain-containing protein [Pyrinomonadaceae bacterium]MDW8304628.1 PAS domain-containing protein [Acidobacteriota bacterium]